MKKLNHKFLIKKKLFLIFAFFIIILTAITITPKKIKANEINKQNNTKEYLQIAAIPQEPGGAGGEMNIVEGPKNSDFDILNPLKIVSSPNADQLSTPGGIVSRLLAFLFPLAGLILFLLISWGGFEILTSSSNQKGMEAGKNRITAAIIGFILLFSTYWLAQIVEIVFGITIL